MLFCMTQQLSQRNSAAEFKAQTTADIFCMDTCYCLTRTLLVSVYGFAWISRYLWRHITFPILKSTHLWYLSEHMYTHPLTLTVGNVTLIKDPAAAWCVELLIPYKYQNCQLTCLKKQTKISERWIAQGGIPITQNKMLFVHAIKA